MNGNFRAEIDTYGIASNTDVTFIVTAINKSRQQDRDREVRLLVEVKIIIPC